MLDTHTGNNMPTSLRRQGHALTMLLVLTVAFVAAAQTARAQGTTFMYQGRLTEAGANASGPYDLEFKLYDAAGGQVGPALTREDVPVADGVFTVPLDFGHSPFTTAAAFTLEVGVRPGNSNGAFTALAPRQPITSSPYAIQTLNAQQLGGVPADQYVKTDDPRLTNGLPPAPGSDNYIQSNPASQQAGAGFNVSGNGTLGGVLQATEVRAQTGTGFYGLTHTDGATAISTYVGGSSSGASGGWLGTRTNSPLHFFTNNGQPKMTIMPDGRVGIGTHTPQSQLTLQTGASGYGLVQTDGTIRVGSYVGNTGANEPGGWYGTRSDHKLFFFTNGGNPSMTVDTTGSVGIGTTSPSPRARLHVVNSGGNLFSPHTGIFSSVNSRFDIAISAANTAGGTALRAEGNVRQNREGNGVVKAMVYVNNDGSIARCYSSETIFFAVNCGIRVRRNISGWLIDFGFKVDDRFWAATLGIGVASNIALTVGTTTPNEIAVKIARTDIPNHSGEGIHRSVMLIVY